MTFNKLFEGNLDAYLTYDDPKDTGDVVKVKPDYLTVKRVDDKRTIKPDAWAEIIDEAIAKHLAGRKSFGVAPQRDGKVRWGALDIDHYPYLLTDDDVFAFIRAWGDPCLVSRSKSGGVHVYAFTEDWVEEDHMRRYLCAKRDALLKGDILKKAQEVFPKEVDGDDKMPPRINLPGYRGRVVLGWSKPGLIELCWSTDESKRRDPDWAAIYNACKVPHAHFLETILADLTAGPPDRRKSERKKTKWAGGYRKPTEGPAMAGRNAYLYSCGASARARGADDAEVEAVMREVLEECENPEHVLYKATSDDPFTEAEFQRCLKQVLALEQGETKISFSKVETINEEWGLMNTHGKAEFLNMLTLEVSDKQSFLLFNAHRAAEVDAWLQDPDKRQYSGYVLEDPRTYEGTGFNMFTGWVHTPTTGDVRLGPRERTIVWADRFRGVSYVDIVDHLVRLRNAPPFTGKTQLLIDGTSLGRVVSDQLDDARCPHVAVQMVTGQNWVQKGKYCNAGKSLILETLAVMFASGDLRWAKDLPLRKEIEEDLASFQLTETAAGNQVITQSRNSGGHGDMGVSLAICAFASEYLAKRNTFSVSKLVGYYG